MSYRNSDQLGALRRQGTQPQAQAPQGKPGGGEMDHSWFLTDKLKGNENILAQRTIELRFLRLQENSRRKLTAKVECRKTLVG